MAEVRVRHTKSQSLHLLELPPDLGALAQVREFVDSLDLVGVLTPARIFDLKVALSEAAANAIEHAGAMVNVALWILNDRVIVDVSNVGEFGVTTDEQPGGRNRGYGLKLMVCLSEEVTFTRGKRGKTTVRLTFMRDRYQVPADRP